MVRSASSRVSNHEATGKAAMIQANGKPRQPRAPFRFYRNGALDSCFDAFSSREPVSTSLENALAERSNGVLASMTSTAIGFRVSAWLAGQTDLRNDIRNARCCSGNGSASRPP